jgi:dTDP-glucose pyrophosphorylase
MSNSERLDGILVPPDMQIFNAIEVLNNAHKRIILVVDTEQRLLGVVTDSNIRHAVLYHHDLQRPICEIMRSRPVTCARDASEDEILRLMEQTHCYQIPIVDENSEVVDIRFLDEILRHHVPKQLNTAIILAGGLGSRLAPITKKIPKSLVLVGDKPMLFMILDQLIASGVQLIYLMINYLGGLIKEAVMEVPHYWRRVQFLEEPERLGTAGPLSLIRERPEGPFVVMNGDLLTKVAFDEMLRFHIHEKNVLTMAVRERKYQVPYGVVKLEGTRVLGISEKPEYTDFINAGIYILEPVVLDRVPKKQRWDMPELIDDLIQADLRVGCFPVHEYWIDIGDPNQLERAKKEYPGVFGTV